MIENRIRRIRKIRGLKLADVAVALDVHPATVSRWERHTQPVPDESKVRLARLFDVPVVELFDWTAPLRERAA